MAIWICLHSSVCLFYVLLNIDSLCCCCSVSQSYLILCTSMDCRLQASLSFTIAHSLLKLMSVKSVTPSNHLILCRPLLLPSIFPGIRVFSNKSVLHIRWPKYWSFLASASVLPMNIQDWFPLGLTGLISLQSKGLSRVFFNTTFQKHQFVGTQLSLRFNSHIHTWLLEKQ